MANDNPNDPEVQDLEIEAAETERTLPEHRLCVGCGTALTGRRPQAKFCSARCRTATRRNTQTADLNRHLATIEASLAALKKFGGRS